MNKVLMTDRDLLASLVSFDSTSCNSNLPIADFICNYLEHPMVRIERNGPLDEGKVNLVIHLGTEDKDRRGLTLSGHLDVVPATEPEWSSDPFQLHETEEAYVARGACDMKGFVAMAVNMLKSATDSPPRCPLALLLTFDEELGTRGADYFRRTWDDPLVLPRYVIVGEPTQLKLVRMHKGHLKLRLATSGKSAHSGYPHLGDNAIETMGVVINALSRFGDELAAEPSEASAYYREAPTCSVNQAMIGGGSAINIIPDQCALDVGIRLLPGVDAGVMTQRVRELVDALPVADRVSVEEVGVSPSLNTSESSELNQVLCGFLEQEVTHAVSYASDGGVLAQMNMECVLFGPGDIAVAHRPNEYVPKQDMVAARRIVESCIQQLCYT
ncbi:MAG: M20 family metallopeptidase [Planctomycetota bacterium]|jgi:acetylornithine deacetylase